MPPPNISTEATTSEVPVQTVMLHVLKKRGLVPILVDGPVLLKGI